MNTHHFITSFFVDHISNVEQGGTTVIQLFPSDQDKIDKNHDEAFDSNSVDFRESKIILETL